MAFGSVAWGQPAGQRDDYYYRSDQARDQGYQNGYRDGLRAGQYDLERGRRFKFKNDDWEDSRGYEHWMGNKGEYKQAYRDGYERGYRRGYRDRDYYRDRDRDDWR
jgi:flagellar biosynthesis/type III secretory pathway protein FliH